MARLMPTSDELSIQVCKALGLDPGMVARLIIDLDAREPDLIPVYVQMYGSMEMLEIDWEAALKGAEVIECKKLMHDHTDNSEL